MLLHFQNKKYCMQGRILDFWKVGSYVQLYKDVGIRFADFISFFLNIS